MGIIEYSYIDKWNGESIHFENGYSLYKFFESISNIIGETTFLFNPSERLLRIRDMDPSRICMLDVVFEENGIVSFNGDLFDSTKEVSLNLEDLAKILKVRKNDKKEFTFAFGETALIIQKENKDINTIKTLEYLDLEKEEIPIENLNALKYDSKVVISKNLLDHFFYESGLYSDVITIEFEKTGIHFKENGSLGECDTFFDLLKLEDFRNSNEESTYSLTFLSLLKHFLAIMNKNDTLTIKLKKDTPLKVKIEFRDISCKVLFYIAPRCEEEDIDYEDEEF